MSGRAERDHYLLLRSEWLRFRSHLYDASTALPTLAAVLDDTRRLLEERGSLGLVYLDLAEAGQLEALHGWQWYDAQLKAFARSLLDLKRDGYLEPRDIAAVLSVRSDKFLLILGGPGSFALDRTSLAPLVARVRERIAQGIAERQVGPAGGAGLDHGYALLYRDPMLRAERALYKALDEAMYMSLRQRSRARDESARSLDALIREQRIVTHYQPILRLDDMAVLGHEVFSRGSPGGALEDAERLFALAQRTGRLLDLERLCRRRALLTARGHLGDGSKLFINTSAPALRDPELTGPGFVEELEAQGMQPGDVVLEISERVSVEERESYREALRQLKARGFGVAIADMGAGYASLQSIVDLEPDYLKFDIALVRNIDKSLIKRSLLETLVELSQKIGAAVIAEGIEAESELQTLRELGVRLGQGRFLAPPVAVQQEPAAVAR
jgi:EAL domain-containing protein (putative c-di-GMP-specific phosphodiesterase class I)/GGDEF domain-containing protein